MFLFALFALIAMQVHAQITITGTVKSAQDGMGLPGVNVYAKGFPKTGTVTNAEGQYTVQVSQEATILVFTFVGMKTQEVSIAGQTTIDITMENEDVTLGDVVVVGYGTQKKANLTGAVSSVLIDKTLESRPISDVGRGLQGSAPGLTVSTQTGDLGTKPDLRLRGLTGSLNGGGNKPLILVDNVEVPDIQLVNPDDIESISILKDAASSSIYGSRATWGVILITTKTGSKNVSKISYSTNISYNTPTNMPKMANAADGATLGLLTNQRSNPSQTVFGNGIMGYYDLAAIEKMKEWETLYGGQDLGMEMLQGRDFEIINNRFFFYRPWDVGELYIKKWTPQQNHNLSFSGGNEKTTYNVSLGYVGQDGILKVNQDKYERYNLNASIQTQVSKYLDIRASTMISKSTATKPFSFGGSIDPWYYLYRWSIVHPYGTINGNPVRNAITETEQAKMIPTETEYFRGTIGGTLKPIKDLEIDFSYTYAKTNGNIHEVGGAVKAINHWDGPTSLTTGPIYYTSASYNRVKYTSSWAPQSTFKAYATYSKKLSEHNIKVMVGTDAEEYEFTQQVSQRLNLVDLDKGELGLATGDQSVSGVHEWWSTLGYFGRLNYNFKEKYLLELNGRFDGSSRFPVGDKWAFFPSISAGYRLTEEDFMEIVKPYLSTLKIRGSWGSLGNNDIATSAQPYPYLSTMGLNSASGWIINGLQVPTFNMPTALSPSLTWEKVVTFDLGFDSRFWNDKIGIVFDWYTRTTSGMLSPGITLPTTFGTTSPRRNFGEMQTKGWELTLDFVHKFQNGLNLSIIGTLTDFQEKITKYENLTKNIYGYYDGKVLGEIWGYETDRYFTDGDFTGGVYNPDVPSQAYYESGYFKFGPGDVKYKDLNGDGVINPGTSTLDDHGDLKVIGNSTPRYQYSFRISADWKGIDLDIFFQGIGKRDIWPTGAMALPGFRAGDGCYEHHLDYWTLENPDAFYPRPADLGEGSIRNFLPQTKYLADFSYLRLKNITIGYTLPLNISKKLYLEKCRIYVGAENLWTKTPLHLPIDPEILNSSSQSINANYFGRAYPYRKAFSFGLQIIL